MSLPAPFSNARAAWDMQPPSARYSFVALLLIFLLLVALIASLFVGDVPTGAATVRDALFHYDAGKVPHVLIRDGRLPRALADVLVGAAFAVAGAIMQAVTRNPLASPGVMGLNTGASFTVVLAIVFVPTAGRAQLMLISIAGAALGATLVYGIAALSRGGPTPVRLALTGLAVSALLGAIGSGVMIYEELGQDVLLWHARGSEGVRWLDLGLFSPLAAVGLFSAFAIAPTLGVLSLGDQVSRELGLRTKTSKILAGMIVLVLAGGAVSLAGPVGFVGLMIPHIVRHLVGHNHRLVILGSVMGGALLMLGADLVARLSSTPNRVAIPVGVVTALIGVPFFLYLACRRPKAARFSGGQP